MNTHGASEGRQAKQPSSPMSCRRRVLMAYLAAERSELHWQVLGIDEQVLSELPIFREHGWTVKDVLAHIAAWDRWEHRTMVSMLTGEGPDLEVLEDIDAFNAAVVAVWRHKSLAEVLAELKSARETWLAWLCQVPSEEFFCSRWFQEWDWAFPNCLEVQWRHDAEHARQIAAWRAQHALEDSSGPKTILRAALDAARTELLAAADLVPPEERTSRGVCGEWTLKDVAGHLADWERVGVEGLRDMARGRMPRCEHIADIDSWNEVHAEARRDEPWEDTWADLERVRESLVSVLEETCEEALVSSHHFPWGPQGTAYQWVRVFIAHDREHAEGLRTALGVRAERGKPA